MPLRDAECRCGALIEYSQTNGPEFIEIVIEQRACSSACVLSDEVIRERLESDAIERFNVRDD